MAKKRIFISYSRSDMQYLERLQADFMAADIAVWIDHLGLQVGTPDWEDSIRAALAEADAVILVASPNSRDSNFVRDEIAVAVNNGKPVFPVWVAGDHWNDAIPLGRGMIQYADLRGQNYQAGVQQVIQAVLALPPPAVAVEPTAHFVTSMVPKVAPETTSDKPIPPLVRLPRKEPRVPAGMVLGAVIVTVVVMLVLLTVVLNNQNGQPDSSTSAVVVTESHPTNPPIGLSSTLRAESSAIVRATPAVNVRPQVSIQPYAPNTDTASAVLTLNYDAPVRIPRGWQPFTSAEITLSVPPELRRSDPDLGTTFFNQLLGESSQSGQMDNALAYMNEHTRLYLANFADFRSVLIMREDIGIPIPLSQPVLAARAQDILSPFTINPDDVQPIDLPMGTAYHTRFYVDFGDADGTVLAYVIVDGAIWTTILFPYRETDATDWEPIIDQIMQTVQVSASPTAESTP